MDLAECMAGFDADADGEVSLQEWRAGLTARTKALMARRLDDRGLIAVCHTHILSATSSTIDAHCEPSFLDLNGIL